MSVRAVTLASLRGMASLLRRAEDAARPEMLASYLLGVGRRGDVVLDVVLAGIGELPREDRDLLRSVLRRIDRGVLAEAKASIEDHSGSAEPPRSAS